MEKVKYPRTYHFPWSETIGSDDKLIRDFSRFKGKEIVILEKMDGECSTLARNYMHARSTESGYHPSRSWLQNFHASFAYRIPENIRLCAENLFAQHSIVYDKTNPLRSYLYVFNAWYQDTNTALSWDDTVELCNELSLEMPDVLYRGEYDEKVIQDVFKNLDKEKHEGIVVRVTHEIPYDEFQYLVGKCVRANHVQTGDHWMHAEIKTNQVVSD
ncbi:RNA ligase family protein [Vibrio owensii]|uniref:RNA ligase family protein n=1 Tax=Vibrio harveyi group TaxID=717610 RepID=UPI003CC6BBD7